MLKVGLTGGYATGKSTVAAELERLGCHLIFADQLGHLALSPTGAAYQPTIQLFGPGILEPDSTINRKKLAAIVFQSPEKLAQLNAIVHPAVYALEAEKLAEFNKLDPHGIAVVEAAILVETGRYKHFDKLIVTVCDEETQIARGIRRDNVSREEVVARLTKQLSLAEKKRYADFVIDTGGSKEDTAQKVQQVFISLKKLAEAKSI